MIKTILAVAGMILLVALSGCIGSSLNDNPADYIKQVSAIKDGDGLQVYFILADKSGQMTTADGSYVLDITQDGSTLFKSKSVNVTKSTFEKRSVGMGNFAHEVVMHLVGRISYQDMRRVPDRGSGEVKITFRTADGKVIEGSDSIFF
jgi:hypothetical protein